MWWKSKTFKYGVYLLLALCILYMASKVSFLWDPAYDVLQALLVPLIIASLLYYVLRIPVNLLARCRIPRSFCILITFLVLLGVIALVSTLMGSIVVGQLSQFVVELPRIYQSALTVFQKWLESEWADMLPVVEWQTQIVAWLTALGQKTPEILTALISRIGGVGTTMIMVPILLFYFLLDDRKVGLAIASHLPGPFRTRAKELVKDVDHDISAFISGQLVIATIAAAALYVGYLVLGIPYAVMLALFAPVRRAHPAVRLLARRAARGAPGAHVPRAHERAVGGGGGCSGISCWTIT